MTTPNRQSLLRRASKPWLWLLLSLSAAAGLAFAPPRWTSQLKTQAATALLPGQRAALHVETYCRQCAAQLGLGQHIAATGPDSAALPQGERAALRNDADLRSAGRVRELEAEVAALRATAAEREQATSGASGQTVDPLLVSQLVTARVLGSQARGFLSRRAMLEVGSDAGVDPGTLVLEDSPTYSATLVDIGARSGLESGRLVLAGRKVVGKLLEVGRQTSTVQRATDAGFRDLVRLSHDEGGQLNPGPRGLLVGTGEPLCRLRMVDANQPVAVGDIVLAAGLEGIASAPPRYGVIVRAERSAGGPHWEIWVRPAVTSSELSEVAVLRTEVNPIRVAGNDSMTKSQ